MDQIRSKQVFERKNYFVKPWKQLLVTDKDIPTVRLWCDRKVAKKRETRG